MNQRIGVRAIIRKDEKTLILRRSSGRPAVLGKYELLGGKLQQGEQPDEAVLRLVREDIGIEAQYVQLYDVVTYIDADERDMQRIFIVYLVSLDENPGNITLNSRYDHFIWKKDINPLSNDLSESTKLMLTKSQHSSVSVFSSQIRTNDDISTTPNNHVIIYSDGGSRGNPGPSASGFVILDANSQLLHEGGLYLGITTNNQAEYHGVRLGLEKALEIGAKTVDFRIDSLLVVNQMNNIYKIKNRELWPINERIRELTGKFDKVTFSHVRREFNQLADGMVNKILNAHAQE